MRRRVLSKLAVLVFLQTEVPQEFLCTYFEPTETRRLFPCWDEPMFRANFELTVIAEANLEVVSNTPVASCVAFRPTDSTLPRPIDESLFVHCPMPSLAKLQAQCVRALKQPQGALPSFARPDGSYKVVRFTPTPVMCTYLVALIIGPLHYLEQVTKTGLCVRVYVPTAVPVEQGGFVLELAVKAVAFWERFFEFPFPLPKLDIVGVPELSALGMENVGCQVFHLQYLAVHAGVALSRRQRIARLVGHEISHQWFGNIVAIEWWSHLWLKEGFARYKCAFSIPSLPYPSAHRPNTAKHNIDESKTQHR